MVEDSVHVWTLHYTASRCIHADGSGPADSGTTVQTTVTPSRVNTATSQVSSSSNTPMQQSSSPSPVHTSNPSSQSPTSSHAGSTGSTGHSDGQGTSPSSGTNSSTPSTPTTSPSSSPASRSTTSSQSGKDVFFSPLLIYADLLYCKFKLCGHFRSIKFSRFHVFFYFLCKFLMVDLLNA